MVHATNLKKIERKFNSCHVPHVHIKANQMEERGANVFCIVETKIEYGNIFYETRLQSQTKLCQNGWLQHTLYMHVY